MNWEDYLIELIDYFINPLLKTWLVIYILGVLCYYL